MAAQVIDPELHPLMPVARCLERVAAALDELPEGALPRADAHAFEVTIQEAERQERKLRELRLRLSHAADQSSVAASSWRHRHRRLAGTADRVQRCGDARGAVARGEAAGALSLGADGVR